MSCAPQPTAAAAAGAQEKDPGFPWIRTGSQPPSWACLARSQLVLSPVILNIWTPIITIKRRLIIKMEDNCRDEFVNSNWTMI